MNSWTALHSASSYGNLGALKALLSHPGITVNKKTLCGRTALHTLFLTGRSSRNKDGCQVSLLIFQALLEHPSIDINATIVSGGGTTPLHLACRCGRADLVEALLQHSSRVNVNALAPQFVRGASHSFIIACSYNHWHVVRVLLGCPLLDPASVGWGYRQANALKNHAVAMLIEVHWLGLQPLPLTDFHCSHDQRDLKLSQEAAVMKLSEEPH